MLTEFLSGATATLVLKDTLCHEEEAALIKASWSWEKEKYAYELYSGFFIMAFFAFGFKATRGSSAKEPHLKRSTLSDLQPEKATRLKPTKKTAVNLTIRFIIHKYYTFFVKNAIVETMYKNEYDGTIILPHDTALSEILKENRMVLAETKKIMPALNAIPFYPPHCNISFLDSMKEYKKNISVCRIDPPVFTGTFFVRPVTLSGVQLQPFPFKINREITEQNPTGIIFGYALANNCCDEIKENKTNVDRVKQLVSSFEIKTINLRVFRIFNVKYKTTEQPNTLKTITWQLSNLEWVKTR